jgi:hypothetical protein
MEPLAYLYYYYYYYHHHHHHHHHHLYIRPARTISQIYLNILLPFFLGP